MTKADSTREKAIEAGARAIWSKTEAGMYGIPFQELTASGESVADMALAAFDAFLGVLAESVGDDAGEVLRAARKAVHDGANALGRVAWDVDAERAISAMVDAMR